MRELSQLRLEDPWLLLLLLPVALLFYLQYFSYGPLYAWHFSSIEGMRIRKSFRWWTARSLVWWQALAMLLLIIALARPQWTWQEEEIKAEGIDIFLAMDVSSSMLSRDFEPNRLTVSKQHAIEFVNKRPYDRIGLVVFAGDSYTQSPITTDRDILKEFLRALDVGQLTDGTAIGMGLAAAVNRLKDTEATTKVIILLTDGVNNAGYIAPETATELAHKYGIRVYTIGVGSKGTALSPVGRQRDGEYLFAMARVNIDERLLQSISEQTGGRYFRATSAETLRKIYEEIDALEKTEIEISRINRQEDFFLPFLIASVMAIFMYICLKYYYLKWWPL